MDVSPRELREGDLRRLTPRFANNVIGCFGCPAETSCRTGILSEDILPDRRLRARVRCPAAQQAGPGVAHGGWTATVLDECIGHLPYHLGVGAVTATLTVDYKKPVPLETDLTVEARVDAVNGRRWELSGEMTLPGHGIVAHAHGIWIQRRDDHYARAAHTFT